MDSGQKIELPSNNKSQKSSLTVPSLDDKQRLRKKIEEYKRIQRREYPRRKAAQPQPQIQQQPVQQVVQIKQEKVQEQNRENIEENNNQNSKANGKLQSQLLQQYLDNQFYDQQCVQADKQLENIQSDDSKFKKKMKRVSSIMERLNKSVHQLKNRYDQMDILELLGKKRNKKREAQALAFVKSQVQQKKGMVKKYDSIKGSETKKKQQQQEARKKQEQEEKQKKLKQIKKQLQEKKREKQKQKKLKQEKEQKVKRFLGKYLQQQPLYKILQEKYQKKQKKQQQIQKAFLKKRGEKFKPLDEQQLSAHLKLHYQKIRDKQQVKQRQNTQKQQQIAEKNLKLLQKIYRGKNYERIQQQLQRQEKLKLKGREKRERLKKYEAYVKQNFKPEVKQGEEEDELSQIKSLNNSDNENEEDQEENENVEKQQKEPQYRKVKRYKFLQGKSCGEIIETIKMPLSEKLQRRVGDGYLQHVKNLPKKRRAKDDHFSQQKLAETPSSKSRVVEIPKLPRPKHFSVDVSENPNRQQISNLLILLKSKDGQVDMKRKYLCKLSDRSDYNNVQSQINSNILENIERKLSLLTKL